MLKIPKFIDYGKISNESLKYEMDNADLHPGEELPNRDDYEYEDEEYV